MLVHANVQSVRALGKNKGAQKEFMMLVLSRVRGKAFYIDDTIVIRVLDVYDGSVRFGIEAPKHVKVLRNELMLRKSAPLPEALFSSTDEDSNTRIGSKKHGPPQS